MARMVEKPAEVPAAGEKPKIIEEFVGRVNTGTEEVSVARMRSPEGWTEPGQTPEFEECSVVLKGVLRVDTRERTYDVRGGRALLAESGEWVRYSTPFPGGAEYISVCRPAFSPDNVHRDG